MTDKTPDDQLRDYLARDLAVAKLQLNESRRSSGRLLSLVISLIFLVIACVGGFSATVYFITQEHTKQIRAIFDSRWEKESEGPQSNIYQDTGSGGHAIANIHSNHNTNNTK